VREPASSTILFIPLSPDHCKPGFDWAACGEQIIRCCPGCLRDSIIGHGWRRKQAHDDSHDWIKYRRRLCKLCKVTFTFLPAFSLPYTHYSLVARSQALRRRFLERRSWESAAPPLKDPDRVPDPSTLRRWGRSLDSSQPAFSFLRPTLEAVEQWLARGESLAFGSWRLSWPTVFACLRVFWPWPLRF
jgi:hypothetical protein